MTEEELKLLDKFASQAMNYLLNEHKIKDSFDFGELGIAITAYNMAYDMILSRQNLLE